MEPSAKPSMSGSGRGTTPPSTGVLTTVLSQRQTHATQISGVPANLVEIGQRAVEAIYAAVQLQATGKIELIESNSRKQIDAANHARAEAASRSNDSNAKLSKRPRPPPRKEQRRKTYLS